MIVGNSVEAVQDGSNSLLAQIGKGILFLIHLLSPAAWAAVAGCGHRAGAGTAGPQRAVLSEGGGADMSELPIVLLALAVVGLMIRPEKKRGK